MCCIATAHLVGYGIPDGGMLQCNVIIETGLGVAAIAGVANNNVTRRLFGHHVIVGHVGCVETLHLHTLFCVIRSCSSCIAANGCGSITTRTTTTAQLCLFR